MLFIIGTPRSGSTMLERMLESHSEIYGRPEPHLMTPLAHLGYWGNVDKAPFDHVLAAESTRQFVDDLPNTEADYYDACRAYADTLYGRMLEPTGKRYFLDKTPAYGLVVPFLAKLYPNAKFVVLTRHPLGIFSSFANSFFDGDYQLAQEYNPLLDRYVPVMAWFLREQPVPMIHVRYEDITREPEKKVKEILDFLDLPFEEGCVEYGRKQPEAKGLGDPLGVKKHTRPVTSSIAKWAEELAYDQTKLSLMEEIIGRLDPEDLKTWGYPVDELWKPLHDADFADIGPKKVKMNKYRFQRKLIVRSRVAIKGSFLEGLLRKVKLACDVLLREY
jgi:hypothetical protein